MSSAGYRRKPDCELHPIEIRTHAEFDRAEQLVMRYADVFSIEDFQHEHDPIVLYADILQLDEGEFEATQYWVKTGKELRILPTHPKEDEPVPFLKKAVHTDSLERAVER